jgi:hypothetical protein
VVFLNGYERRCVKHLLEKFGRAVLWPREPEVGVDLIGDVLEPTALKEHGVL